MWCVCVWCVYYVVCLCVVCLLCGVFVCGVSIMWCVCVWCVYYVVCLCVVWFCLAWRTSRSRAGVTTSQISATPRSVAGVTTSQISATPRSVANQNREIWQLSGHCDLSDAVFPHTVLISLLQRDLLVHVSTFWHNSWQRGCRAGIFYQTQLG